MAKIRASNSGVNLHFSENVPQFVVHVVHSFKCGTNSVQSVVQSVVQIWILGQNHQVWKSER